MDISRRVRYILECLNEIRTSLSELSGIILKGIFYNLITSIETAMDIIAMLCKDLSHVPLGDYENIQCLKNQGVINENLAESLAKYNGLRNVLLHRYNGINSKIILDSISDVEKTLNDFIETLEAFLDEH